MNILPDMLIDIIKKREHELKLLDVMSELTSSCVITTRTRDIEDPEMCTVGGYYYPDITMKVSTPSFNHTIVLNRWSMAFDIGNQCCNTEPIISDWNSMVENGFPVYILH